MRKLILLLLSIFSISLFASVEIKYKDITYEKGKSFYNGAEMNGDYLIDYEISYTSEYPPEVREQLDKEREELRARYTKNSSLLSEYKTYFQEWIDIDNKYKEKYKKIETKTIFKIGLNAEEDVSYIRKYMEYKYEAGERKLLKAIYDENKNIILKNYDANGMNISEIYLNNNLYEKYSLGNKIENEYRYLSDSATCMKGSKSSYPCLSGDYELYYKNGKLKESGKYAIIDYLLNIKEMSTSFKDGIIKEFYENGKLKSEVNYSDGLKEGKSSFYKETGQLDKEITYSKGVNTTSPEKFDTINAKEVENIKGLMYYHDVLLNGEYFYKISESKEEEYKSAVTERSFKYTVVYQLYTYENGVFKETNGAYDKDRKIIYSIEMLDGKRNNIVYKNGKLFEKLQVIDSGKFVNWISGPYEYYYENGNLMEKGNYSIFKASVGKESLEDGLVTKYYESGSIKDESNYSNGLKEGVSKQYYESGKIKKEMTFIAGQKEGKEISYNEDGSIEKEEKYRSGKVIN